MRSVKLRAYLLASGRATHRLVAAYSQKEAQVLFGCTMNSMRNHCVVTKRTDYIEMACRQPGQVFMVKAGRLA